MMHIVAISRMYCDGVGTKPRLGVGLAIKLLDADQLECRWPM
jgi:hypothetical protein